MRFEGDRRAAPALQHAIQQSVPVDELMLDDEADMKDRIFQFFRLIDKGLHDILRDEYVQFVDYHEDFTVVHGTLQRPVGTSAAA